MTAFGRFFTVMRNIKLVSESWSGVSETATSLTPRVEFGGIPSTVPREAATSNFATAVGAGAALVVVVDVGTPVFNFISANS